MSDMNETHAEVVKQMRVDGVIANRDGTVAMGGNALLEFAARAEAAHRREIDKLNAVIQAQRSQFDAEIDRLRREKLPGNVAKLCEALSPFPSLCEWLVENATKLGITDMVPKLRERCDVARAALSASPRNCDVGTAEEQSRWFESVCRRQEHCANCKLFNPKANCKFVWAQMPYESEAGK